MIYMIDTNTMGFYETYCIIFKEKLLCMQTTFDFYSAMYMGSELC